MCIAIRKRPERCDSWSADPRYSVRRNPGTVWRANELSFSTFVDGNISRLLYASKPVIASQIRTLQRFNSSGKLFMQPEYPEEAWFEAVVNAVSYRSYSFKTQNIFVKIFDDKFVVESPGGFVPPTTGGTVYDAHNPRNPYLMEAMMHLELTFCGFEGTRRMRQAMVKAKLPEPRFRQIEAHSHQVHVTLENSVENRRPSLSSDDVVKLRKEQLVGLSEDESAIVSYLFQKNKDLNITHAALVLGKSWPTASKAISSLLDREIIELVQGGGERETLIKGIRSKKISDALSAVAGTHIKDWKVYPLCQFHQSRRI